MEKKIIITGYGVVARELCHLIYTNAELIKEKYDLAIKVTGIVGSQGMIYENEGIRMETLLNFGTGSRALVQYAEYASISLQEPRFTGDILVECTPTNIEHGDPGFTYIMKACQAGMDIVSVSKGALVHAYQKISEMVNEKGIALKFSGATAAALPTMDIGDFSLAGATITRIEGILNGTSNYILTEMDEEQLSFIEALKQAQDKGIAERNPSLDVKGFDSACKILLLVNGLFHTYFTIDQIAIEGIEQVTRESMEKAKKQNERIKLLASAIIENGKISLEVKPCFISPAHPLYHVNGTNKGIVFETKEMGTICVTGGASHPRGAAAAALKDIINLCRFK